jgi:SAM-dependent methyltransferase
MKIRIPPRVYKSFDRLFLHYDKSLLRRTRNLRLIPDFGGRVGARPSYGEWCHIVGIFQTLLCRHLNRPLNNQILDIGCGTGIMAIACEPFLGDEGRYTGIDVRKEIVEFCKAHYPDNQFCFMHLNVSNANYAPGQQAARKRWAVEDESMDMLTALSVWSHLNEEDAVFYFREIDRVLKPRARAIVTCYLLDDLYYGSLQKRTNGRGKFHNSEQSMYIFDQASSSSQEWFHPSWAKQPEETIGVTVAGINRMLEQTGLSLAEASIGNWKELPGVFFQDVLVFQKASR